LIFLIIIIIIIFILFFYLYHFHGLSRVFLVTFPLNFSLHLYIHKLSPVSLQFPSRSTPTLQLQHIHALAPALPRSRFGTILSLSLSLPSSAIVYRIHRWVEVFITDLHLSYTEWRFLFIENFNFFYKDLIFFHLRIYFLHLL
jgi:hypothetical protein